MMRLQYLDKICSREIKSGFGLYFSPDRDWFNVKPTTVEVVKGEAHTSHSFDVTVLLDIKTRNEINYSFFNSWEEATKVGLKAVGEKLATLERQAEVCRKTLAENFVYEA